MAKVLFIHPGAIGDQLLCLPLLQSLKDKYLVTYAGRDPGRSLVSELLAIEHSLDLNALSTMKIIQEDLKEAYDEVYCFGVEGSFLKPGTCIDRDFGHGPRWKSWGKQAGLEEIYPWTFNDQKNDTDFILLAPGSGSIQKNAPLEIYKEAFENLKKKLIILLGPAERERGLEKAWRALGYPGELCYVDTAEEMISLYRQANFFIGMDSGWSHLAAVFGLKGVLYYPATDPDRWGPFSDQLFIETNEILFRHKLFDLMKSVKT